MKSFEVVFKSKSHGKEQSIHFRLFNYVFTSDPVSREPLFYHWNLHSTAHSLISLIFLSKLDSESIKTVFSNSAKEIDIIILLAKIDFLTHGILIF